MDRRARRTFFASPEVAEEVEPVGLDHLEIIPILFLSLLSLLFILYNTKIDNGVLDLNPNPEHISLC